VQIVVKLGLSVKILIYLKQCDDCTSVFVQGRRFVGYDCINALNRESSFPMLSKMKLLKSSKKCSLKIISQKPEGYKLIKDKTISHSLSPFL